jgi:hypothetical protein
MMYLLNFILKHLNINLLMSFKIFHNYFINFYLIVILLVLNLSYHSSLLLIIIIFKWMIALIILHY